jgi:hypothetical protein
MQDRDGWPVRILPEVVTSIPRRSKADDQTLGVLLVHHSHGSWKERSRFDLAGNSPESSTLHLPLFTGLRKAAENDALPTVARHVPSDELFPVSVSESGSDFVMMVHLIGAGDLQSHEDVAGVISMFGNWQAGMQKSLKPHASTVLIAALRHDSKKWRRSALLDIGAGLGWFAVSAAAQGYPVIAAELAPRSLHAFHASLAANQLGGLVRVHNVTLGSAREEVCVDSEVISAARWRREEVERGYAAPYLHRRTTFENGEKCGRMAERVVMRDLVPAGVRVGAVRVSAGAWGADVLAGGLNWLEEHRPPAIMIEVDMGRFSRLKDVDFKRTVLDLYAIGYTRLLHGGSVCIARFKQKVEELKELVGVAYGNSTKFRKKAMANVGPPAWCDLSIELLPVVLEENLKNSLVSQQRFHAVGVEMLLLELGEEAGEDELDSIQDEFDELDAQY